MFYIYFFGQLINMHNFIKFSSVRININVEYYVNRNVWNNWNNCLACYSLGDRDWSVSGRKLCLAESESHHETVNPSWKLRNPAHWRLNTGNTGTDRSLTPIEMPHPRGNSPSWEIALMYRFNRRCRFALFIYPIGHAYSY